MKKLPLFLLVILIFFSACGEESKKESDWSRFFSLEYWRTQKEAGEATRQGNQAAKSGQHAYAIGKYRKAYNLYPKNAELPLKISRQYAFLALKNPYAEMEKKEAMFWLMQAYRSDSHLSLKTVQSSPLTVLSDLDFYQALVRNLKAKKYPPDQKGNWVSERLGSIQEMVQEIRVISDQLGRVFSFFYRIGEWIGFQVIFFLLFILFTCGIFRIIGFPLSNSILILAFLITVLVWHLLYRVATGGASGGWEPIIRLSAIGLLVILLLKALPILISWVSREIRWKFKSTNAYFKLQKGPWWGKRKELRSYLYDLEEANEKLLKLGYQILSEKTAPSKEEKTEQKTKELLQELEIIKKQIHDLTAKSLPS